MPGDFDLYRLLLQSSPSCFGAKHTVQVRRAGQKEHWVSEVPSSIAQKVQKSKIMHLLKRREQMQQDRSVQFSWVTSMFPYAFLQRWTISHSYMTCVSHQTAFRGTVAVFPDYTCWRLSQASRSAAHFSPIPSYWLSGSFQSRVFSNSDKLLH